MTKEGWPPVPGTHIPGSQQRDAARASARARRTRQLERLLLTSPPLTREQRERIIAAACRLPVAEGAS